MTTFDPDTLAYDPAVLRDIVDRFDGKLALNCEARRQDSIESRGPGRPPMKLLTRREREGLRESFRPKRIRILFVGEAPPASGRFFYSANSGLYRAMRDAFIAVYPRTNDENFLELFQASGCYLTDLCPKPVDHLNEKLRRRARNLGEEILSEKLIRLRPEKIAPVLRAIKSHVEKAALRANWHGQLIELPYPGRWHRHRLDFLKALAPTLQELLRSRRGADNRHVSDRLDDQFQRAQIMRRAP